MNLNSTTNAWQSYLFADKLHPTPYGHQLLSFVFFRTFAQKSWN